MKPDAIIQEVRSLLFADVGVPASRPDEVEFVPKARKAQYIVQMRESEPGSFKDRYIMERDPHSDRGNDHCGGSSGQPGIIYTRGEYHY